MTNAAKLLLERVASWPDEDIEKLEEAARQIEALRTAPRTMNCVPSMKRSPSLIGVRLQATLR
jgi:hypothetical protein